MSDENVESKFRPELPKSLELYQKLRAMSFQLGERAKVMMDSKEIPHVDESDTAFAGLDDATPPMDVKLGPIDRVKPFDVAVEKGGMVHIGLKVYRDGSPFVFDSDFNAGIGSEGYDLIMLPEYPPFLAAQPQLDQLVEIDHPQPWTGAASDYIKATLDGSLNESYKLTEEDCESLLAAFSDANLEDHVQAA